MSAPSSLRTELLINLAILAGTALALGVGSVIMLYQFLEPRHALVAIVILIVADVGVFLWFVAYQVDRVVLRPLRDAMASAEAIANGDLDRRIEPGNSAEMANLAGSVNRMTDRLLQERAHLVRAEKLASIGRLASGVAHEIGNPLSAITGYVHILRNAPVSPASPSSAAPDRSVQALDGMERELTRIDRIIRGLLDYARTRPRTAADIDLADTIQSVVELLRGQGVLRTVDLTLSLAPEPLFVRGERHDVEQAMVNLMLNAVDAMQGRGTLGVITRATSRAELLAGTHRSSDSGTRPPHSAPEIVRGWLENVESVEIATVAIIDSGPGVPDADVERIFEPFYTTKEPGKGTGLGLAIAARAVENCGGTIWASRSREGGAAFRILLPLTRPTSRASGAFTAGARTSSVPAYPSTVP